MDKKTRTDGESQDQKRTDLLKQIGLFVLDMDGTFYLGDHVIEGALEFVRYVEGTGRRVLFFTNNSSRSPRAYMERLAAMGCGQDIDLSVAPAESLGATWRAKEAAVC